MAACDGLAEPLRLRRRVPLWRLWLGGLLVVAAARPALAQPDHMVPSRSYQSDFIDFYEGNYKAALEHFRNEGRTAVKTPTSRWIDSICYEAMCGECYYQMGDFDKALGHYTSALEIYLAYPTWMVEVSFGGIQPDAGLHKPPPWAARRLQGRLGQFPKKALMGQGQVDLTAVVQQGGVLQKRVAFPIEPDEIVRATALAIRRRGELLGPLAQHDPMSESLIVALSRRPGPPNHWSEAWINLELGLALAAGGREAQAVPVFQRAAIAAGEYVHPLSALAYLELGRIAAARGEYLLASQNFEEATYAAYYYQSSYPDPGVLEEAFRYGAIVHLMANRKGMFPPLAPALQWARGMRLRQLQASLSLSAAENAAVLGQTTQAAELIEEARMVIGRRTMAAGRIGARRNFLTGLVAFQQKKVREGQAAVAAALKFMDEGSLRLYHIGLVDNFYSGGKGSAGGSRDAFDLFSVVLRDPTPAEWSSDPLESLAVLSHQHPQCYEHWFEAALNRRNHEETVEIADRARRHRFLTTLPWGGRLESLRWVLEAPKEALSRLALLQRQDLLSRFPEYEQLRQQAEALRKKLSAMPLVAEGAEALRQQGDALKQLVNVGRRQREILAEMAVRREPAELAFPPLRTTADIEKSLPKGHAALIFFTTAKATHAFLIGRERYCDWPLSVAPQVLNRQTAALLREMGNYQSNHEIGLKDLADAKWKRTAHDLLDALLRGSRADFTTKFDELVIVPDGVLWYLPFEALQVSLGGQMQPLISRFRIRYAPTASLVTSPPGWGHRRGNTAVVVGRPSPRLPEEAPRAAFAQLSKAVPGSVSLRAPLPAASGLYSRLLDRLIVLDDLAVTPDLMPYGWGPLGLDHGKPGSTLADWLALPWFGPEEIILPGFHTASEDSLKRVGRSPAPGNELFLAVCGLMADGARTVLLSRWRTGGQTSLDLAAEFVQELPHTTPADAWQRAVLVVANSRLNFDVEPRLQRGGDEPPRANHPFFWAGYMLVDDGVEAAAEPKAAPARPDPLRP